MGKESTHSYATTTSCYCCFATWQKNYQRTHMTYTRTAPREAHSKRTQRRKLVGAGLSLLPQSRTEPSTCQTSSSTDNLSHRPAFPNEWEAVTIDTLSTCTGQDKTAERRRRRSGERCSARVTPKTKSDDSAMPQQASGTIRWPLPRQ